MKSEIKSELKQIKHNPKEFRRFGLIVGSVFILLALLFQSYFWLLLIVGLFLLLSALVLPKTLRHLYTCWMSTGIILGFFILRLLLVILYVVVIIPIGLLARLFRKKQNPRMTYWIKHHGLSNPDNPY